MTIGKKLAQLMYSHNVKEMVLAKHLGISPTRLNNYINDKSTPNMDLLANIASYFSVELSYFTSTGTQDSNHITSPIVEVTGNSHCFTGKYFKVDKDFFDIHESCTVLVLKTNNPYFPKGTKLICTNPTSLKDGDTLISISPQTKLYKVESVNGENVLSDVGSAEKTNSDTINHCMKIQCTIKLTEHLVSA